MRHLAARRESRLQQERPMKFILASVLALSVVAAAGVASAHPHHPHKVCTMHHHHRVCRMVG